MEYVDYELRDGKPVRGVGKPAIWRCSAGVRLGRGFELTADRPLQDGQLLCTRPCPVAAAGGIRIGLEYTIGPNLSFATGGEGFCLALLDPTVPEWDKPAGQLGRLGLPRSRSVLLAVGFDLSGRPGALPRAPNTVSVLSAAGVPLCSRPVPGGLATERWRRVEVGLESAPAQGGCLVSVKVGETQLFDKTLAVGLRLPAQLGASLSGRTTNLLTNAICVNNIVLTGKAQSPARPSGWHMDQMPCSPRRRPRNAPRSPVSSGRSVALVEAMLEEGRELVAAGLLREGFVQLDRCPGWAVELTRAGQRSECEHRAV